MHRFSFQYRTLVYQIAIAGVIVAYPTPIVFGAELDTRLPTDQGEVHTVPLNIDIPSQSLGSALNQLGRASNLNIAYPTDLTKGKTSPAIKGKMTAKQALQKLLENNGLEPDYQGNTVYIKPQIPKSETSLNLKEVQVRTKRFHEIGPLPGLGLTKEEIPGNVQSITAKEIKESHAVSLADLMNSKLQSVNVNDYQSNPFQMDVTYRGFTASPQLGTAQGLSVFLDGIRVNEPFGDVVNWDMIPMNALNSLDVFPGSNPLFGLGTLGGAISMKTKSGFDSNEGTMEYLGGSFKRNQFQGSVGGNNGVIAGFVAANIFREDGWRDNSPSEVNQVFGKAEWLNDKVQLGLSMLYAGNKLVGNGMLPTEIAQNNTSQVFTSPDETKNRLLQFQFNGLWDVSDNFNITGQIYKRKSRRFSSTGDVNQDFGGNATRRPNPGEKPGYFAQDIDKDGLPDLDLSQTILANVAVIDVTDSFGNITQQPVDVDGDPQFLFGPTPIVIGQDQDGNDIFDNDIFANPAFDANNLAIGSNGNTAFVFTNPAVTQSTAAFTNLDGSVVNRPAWGFNPNPASIKPEFDPAYYQAALSIWNAVDQSNAERALKLELNKNGYDYSPSDWTATFIDKNGFVGSGSFLVVDRNRDANGDFILQSFSEVSKGLGSPIGLLVRDPVTGIPYMRDGADCERSLDSVFPDCKKGYIEGTPVALVTETQIDQLTDGASMQLNWNTEHHKFMVGMSIDSSDSTYQSGQRLGIFDNKRNVILDPNQVGYEFAAASQSFGLNDFSGNSITKSLYFNETWTPNKEWAFTASGRYNFTKVKNDLAISNILGLAGATQFKNFYDILVLCNDLNGNGTIEYETQECPSGFRPFSFELAEQAGAIGKGETEKFTYRSFNPSFGATWQPLESLNLYGNWSRGARTPSVIELGCAYDATPVRIGVDLQGNPTFGPRSLIENRFCSLPTTLSGDPYLKQVRSETVEFGARGYLTSDIQWNASIYQTDLQDDIYFVSSRPERSFFQNIGDTRRRGLELGLQGKADRVGFRLNYSLTNATFQDTFQLASPNNSSAGNVVNRFIATGFYVNNGYQNIAVTPGNRMPGIPLHNLNANFTYDLTPNWQIGMTAIMHSESFIRGNENNKHRAGQARFEYSCRGNNAAPTVIDGISYGNETCTKTDLVPTRSPGKISGYAVYNLNTTYKITKGLTAGFLVNNVFNREYFSGGRLGINPFSPSINGAIGPGGFNYNSNDWLATTFLAPGAPRSAFFTLTYDFDLKR